MAQRKTAGETLAAELRTMFRIGPRTRWDRKTSKVAFGAALTRGLVIERVFTSINYPGYDDERRTAIFKPARTALYAWVKHVDGYRVDASLVCALTVDSSPWAWTAYLGRMVDSGCSNVGEFETWFSVQARELHARRATA